MDEKEIVIVAEKLASKLDEKKALEIQDLGKQLLEAKEKLEKAEGACEVVTNQLAEVNKKIEFYKTLIPGVDVLVDPPVLMPVSEALSMVRGVMPSSMVERAWGLGAQRMCQDLRRVTEQLQRREK